MNAKIQKPRLKRLCKRCGKIFLPDGKFCYICDKCKAKSKIHKIEKQRKFYELKGGVK